MKYLSVFSIQPVVSCFVYFNQNPFMSHGGGSQNDLTVDTHKQNQVLADEILYLLDVERHEAELLAQHGRDGQKVVEVLHHTESHGHQLKHSDGKEMVHPHLVFSLSPDQLKILRGSKRWKAMKAIFEITHDVIESEVEHIIRFRFKQSGVRK